MKRRLLVVLLLGLSSASCGVGSDPFSPDRVRTYPAPVFGANDSVFTDDQLLLAEYSTYLYPPGFYQEPPVRIAPYYVNTVSIAPPASRPFEWRELATDDPAQARAWADSSVAYANHVAPLDTTAYVTRKYIEFLPGTVVAPDIGVPMRAHRLAYLDRRARNRLAADSLEGRLNARPIDTAASREVAEYLWYLDHRQIHGAKVLSSYGREGEGVFVQVIHHLSLVVGDYGLRDRIELFRTEYRVDALTGDIVRRDVLLRSTPGQSR